MLAVVVVGAGYRVWLTAVLPAGYDEVYGISLGMEDALESPGAALFQVPLTRSSAITPLWWWVEYAAVAAMGGVSLIAIRIVPILLGVLLPPLAFFATRRSLGRRAALIYAALIALSENVAVVNSRADFFESLALVFAVPLAAAVGESGFARPRRVWFLGLLGCGLLMTFLGKGAFILILFLCAKLALMLVVPAARVRRLTRLAAFALVAVVPTVGYLALASSRFPEGIDHHEVGHAGGVTDLITKLTIEYPRTKAHVTGTPRDAAQLFLDFDVWPIAAMTAVPILAAIFATLVEVTTGGLRVRGRRRALRIGLAVWTVLGVWFVVGRGATGARFHLLYLPAAWALLAMSVDRLLCRSGRSATAALVAVGIASVAFLALSAGWTDWTEAKWSAAKAVPIALSGALTAGVVVRALRSRRWRARVAPPVLMLAWVLANGIAGPFTWAAYTRAEPGYGTAELAALDAYRSGRAEPPAPHGRTLFIDLANYHLKSAATLDATECTTHLTRALRYARAEVRRAPGDPRAWFYLGEALRRGGAPPGEVIAAWERSLALRDDPRLAALVAELRPAAGTPPDNRP